jgi:small nuclear ribonucleoprotein (snRNP)-like protein
LSTRYGGSEVKRYSIPLSMYSNTVETRLKQITVVVLPTSRLYSGELEGLDIQYNV